MKKCMKCNYESKEKNEKFCPKCGAKLENKDNKKKIVIIVAIVFLGLILFSIMMGLIIGQMVGVKEEITLRDYEQYMEKNLCEVIQNTTSINGVIINQVQESENCKYYIGFINVNEENRSAIYKQLIEMANSNSGNITGKSTINNSLNNFYSYTIKGDIYVKVVLNKNTILIGQSKLENKALLNKVFDDFGYSSSIDVKNISKIFSIMYYTILLVFVVILLVSLYKFFKKMNIAGYKAFIPFYNLYVLVKSITDKKWLYIILFIEYLLFIIIIGLNFMQFDATLRLIYFIVFFVFVILYFILFINISINLALSFGKERGYAVLIFFVPVVGIPMLAFGNNKYNKVK